MKNIFYRIANSLSFVFGIYTILNLIFYYGVSTWWYFIPFLISLVAKIILDPVGWTFKLIREEHTNNENSQFGWNVSIGREPKKEIKNDPSELLVVVKDEQQAKDVVEMFLDLGIIINNVSIQKNSESISKIIIVSNNATIQIVTDAETMKGSRGDYYLNLTGNEQIEKDILKPYVNSRKSNVVVKRSIKMNGKELLNFLYENKNN